MAASPGALGVARAEKHRPLEPRGAATSRGGEGESPRPAPPARVLAPAIPSALTRRRCRCLRAFSSTGCRRLLPVPGRLSGE